MDNNVDVIGMLCVLPFEGCVNTALRLMLFHVCSCRKVLAYHSARARERKRERGGEIDYRFNNKRVSSFFACESTTELIRPSNHRSVLGCLWCMIRYVVSSLVPGLDTPVPCMLSSTLAL